MGMIRLNIDALLAQSPCIAGARQTVSQVRSSVDSLYRQIDSKILMRSNIGSRMRTVSRQLEGIESKIGRIQNAVEYGVNSYYSADQEASRRAGAIGK